VRAAEARPAYGTFQTGQQPVRSLRDDELAVPGRQDAPADGADRHHHGSRCREPGPGGDVRLKAVGLDVANRHDLVELTLLVQDRQHVALGETVR